MKKLQRSPQIQSLLEKNKESDIELAQGARTIMLDALYRLSLVSLTEEEFDLLESSLRRLPAEVIGYLLEISKYARNTQKNTDVEDVKSP